LIYWDPEEADFNKNREARKRRALNRKKYLDRGWEVFVKNPISAIGGRKRGGNILKGINRSRKSGKTTRPIGDSPRVWGIKGNLKKLNLEGGGLKQPAKTPK